MTEPITAPPSLDARPTVRAALSRSEAGLGGSVERRPDCCILQIQAPIATWLQQHAAHDRILYVVLTKGINSSSSRGT